MSTITRNEIKLSFGRPSFTVNHKKRTVTCVINYIIDLPQIIDRTQAGKAGIPAVGLNVGINYPENISVATARCTENDTFDVEKGKEIAEARAESFAYRDAARVIENTYKQVTAQFAAWSYGFVEKSAKILEHNKNYIAAVGK